MNYKEHQQHTKNRWKDRIALYFKNKKNKEMQHQLQGVVQQEKRDATTSINIPSSSSSSSLKTSIELQEQHDGTSSASHRQLQTLGQIDQFRLVHSDTDIAVYNITNGTVINIATEGTANFNIEVTTMNGSVGSILFGHNNLVTYRSEAGTPLAFCGDGNPRGNFYQCTRLIVGTHSITATPYSGNRANGTMGDMKRIQFTIINQPVIQPTKAPTKAPTKSPTNAPTKSPTNAPTKSPTNAPTKSPTNAPTKSPSKAPTRIPTMSPIVDCNIPQVCMDFYIYIIYYCFSLSASVIFDSTNAVNCQTLETVH
jgi:hypothetical protein